MRIKRLLEKVEKKIDKKKKNRSAYCLELILLNEQLELVKKLLEYY